METEISKLTDKTNVYIATRSIKSVKGRYKTIHPTLLFTCRNGKTDMFIGWGENITTQKIKVTSRIDKEKAKVSSWDKSTSNDSLFKRNPIRSIKQLLNRNSLLIQITTYGESSETVELNISGLQEIIEPLQKTCNWK